MLLNSINTAAEYSKVNETIEHLKIEKINITDVVDEIHGDFHNIIGSNVVDFAYGKISSSLSFATDKENFMKLINLLVKITTKLIGGNKLYLSASQFDDNNFVITFKDNYSSMSTHIADALNNLFKAANPTERKKFGISKISLDLAKSLLTILGGKFYFNFDDKKDSGFIFPLNLGKETNSEPSVPNVITEDTQIISKDDTINPVPGNVDEKEVIEEAENILNEKEEEINQDISTSEVIIKPSEEKVEEETTTPYNFSQEYNVDLSQLTCLYIEDQIDSQILYSLQMKDLKDIQYAVSFEEALPLLDKYNFDFILIDINILGEYNGLDALRMIHRLPSYDKLPIIAVTSYVLPGDQDKFIAAGFNDFISKPIFREKVIASLERIFLMQM